jgi:hypothetical protein
LVTGQNPGSSAAIAAAIINLLSWSYWRTNRRHYGFNWYFFDCLRNLRWCVYYAQHVQRLQ